MFSDLFRNCAVCGGFLCIRPLLAVTGSTCSLLKLEVGEPTHLWLCWEFYKLERMSETIRHNLSILQVRKLRARKVKWLRKTTSCFSLKIHGEGLFAPLSESLILVSFCYPWECFLWFKVFSEASTVWLSSFFRSHLSSNFLDTLMTNEFVSPSGNESMCCTQASAYIT